MRGARNRLRALGPDGNGLPDRTIDARTTLDAKTDLRAGFDRFTPENLAANRPIVDLVKGFAAKERATPAQLSLAWLLAQKSFIVPIPGTRNPEHLTENPGAVTVPLSPAELREIDAAFASVTVHGGRMNGEQMKVVDETR